ncbi:protein translocase subunit SecF [Candidatus Berkelbacteria bacterium CG10_big_fil_rev_8_21_14_0_10_41_12]|uniref:Protein-export membrane protein SecF n=1 Tax=Candidatus Berkelbacteria bacterium CG10_big_fil_rev_8_21_14_0_10_41_12 TaxID=1974513 RepID=A0A2M6WWP8_9BACT|nr:MAG: protein translocase subunit SecF [Candidatus Berkelbacteria bacterium CG10_big_fil_rev_8_21_14_0_10_41_12]
MKSIIKIRKIFYILSATLFVLSIVAIFVFKFRIGIDFVGGTLIEFKSSKISSTQDIRQDFSDIGKISSASIQLSGKETATIRTRELSDVEFNAFRKKLSEFDPQSEILSHETIGPTVGKDLTQKSVIGVILAIIGIIFYIAYAFRKIPKQLSYWSFGGSAIVALIHDVVITTGMYVILGKFLGWEVDSLFIVAILTILGFSVHDTIVVFDRIRENLIKNPGVNFKVIVDNSIRQTIDRSLNTSLTVILVLLSMLILGGETIKPFVATLAIGIFFGTYSSIFIASPIMYDWNKYIQKRTGNK